MTVIAFDGKLLAADRRSIDAGGLCREITKIERFQDVLLAITGSWDVGAELREWWKHGADVAAFPPEARKDEASLIVFSPIGISLYGKGTFPMVFALKPCAFGSGRDFAEAAMYLGKDAIEAVAVAAHFQSDCGDGVNVLSFEDKV